METHEDAKDAAARKFAGAVGEFIDNSFKRGRFERLVLVAPPAFLGLLRKSIGDQTSRSVCCEIDKNVVRMEAKEIRTHLPWRL